jgi:amino acid adenylation domain-containing protein
MMDGDVPRARIDRRIDTLVWEQAARTPDATAAVFGTRALSYRELESASGLAAARLRAAGVGRGAMVGIHLERSLEMLVVLLATMKAGAAYIPLDPDFPPDRLRHMVSDSGLGFVVTQAALAADAPPGGYRGLMVEDLVGGGGTPVAADPAGESAGGGDLAYVLYTSGSTGLPKGVAIEHRSVVNFLLSMQREPGIAAGDRLLAVTTLSFDIVGLELYLPLVAGATVVIATRDEAMDGEALRALIGTHGITVLQATPSSWRLLLDAGWEGGAGFKALCGGEPMPLDLAAALGARCGELWNMYGPTETTIWSTIWRVPAGCRQMLVGRPIANTQVHIIDTSGRRVPVGVPGEICIGGDGVGRGYLNRPELTAERFLPDPFASARGVGSGSGAGGPRLYRTGDRGRLHADGNLEHLGRLDFQVKVRGHRIELGEIECQLMAHPALSRAVAMAREDQPGDVRLVAYVVAKPGAEPTGAALAAHLKQHLPAYMVPQHFIRLEAIPLLPNGKVDRKGLPMPPAVTAAVGDVPAPAPRAATGAGIGTGPADIGDQMRDQAVIADRDEDPRVSYLMAVWTRILGTPASPQDNFFDLGGHSMLAAKMANRVARETGHRIKLMPLATQTLAHLAAGIPAAALPSSAAGRGPAPATPGARADAARAERAFFFGSAGRRMFGMHHASSLASSGRAILVAPPLLQEGVVCQRALWTLCESVAAHGGQAMRFDWYGSGDSAGGSDEVTLAGLQLDLRAATLRLPRDGVQPVRVLAFRSACLPVLAAAVEGAQPVDLVLWDPVVRGGPLVDEWRRQHRAQLTGGTRYPHAVRGDRGDAELLGFDVAPGFIEALAQSDFRARALPSGSRLWVVTWPGEAPDVDAFIATQRAAGIALEEAVLHAPDRPAWHDDRALENQVFPRRSVGEVASLLAGART